LLAVALNDKSYASDGTCDEKVEKSSLHTAAAASKKETSSSMPIEDGDDRRNYAEGVYPRSRANALYEVPVVHVAISKVNSA
jgi:hypothetical protein